MSPTSSEQKWLINLITGFLEDIDNRMFQAIIEKFHQFLTRRNLEKRIKIYLPGKTISRWLAPDIRREIEVIDVTEIESGFILARRRTWNVLYAIKGLKEEPSFGEVERLEVKHLWDWTGAPWGGPVPED